MEESVITPNWLLGPVRLFAFLLSIIIWSLVGLIIWIPLLFFTILFLSIRVTHSAISNRPMNDIAKTLDHVIQFYPRGFILIWHAVWGRGTWHTWQGRQEKTPTSWDELALTAFGTIVFWAAIAAAIVLFVRQ